LFIQDIDPKLLKIIFISVFIKVIKHLSDSDRERQKCHLTLETLSVFEGYDKISVW